MQYASQFPLFAQNNHHFPNLLIRPRPRFCILRPGGFWTPLIPLDELPHWLEICNWAPDIQLGMYPASMSYMPREGEYDVVCHHCAHGLDSLHQSVSERDAFSVPSTKSSSEPHGPHPEPQQGAKAQRRDSVLVPTKGHPAQILEQPPFGGVLQAPFAGMCMVDMHSQYSNHSADPRPVGRRMSIENAAAPPSFGRHVGSPPLSMASSGNARRTDTPYPGSPGPQHAHAEFFGKPQRDRVNSLKNESTVSMQSGSVASAPPLTAAAIQRMDRMRRRRYSRGSTLHGSLSIKSGITPSQVSLSQLSKVSQVSKASKISKASMASMASRSSFIVLSRRRRRIILRRQRAEARHDLKHPVSTGSSEAPAPKPKPEQSNSATKRRERRERMMQRKNQTDRGKQPYHNTGIPNWSSGMSKR
ncbi:uncharacterized protein N7515_008086 [Penicillium bovifimosum]|uniref:Uncharacterized protein n=1 Tax=Penicillium bovifimosum TaxID=126998 RepID=A0A9W9GME9_9EURO|nr:uncharacterized protein N7515_008086 [Penicillium bovifimosum]KAJ5124261.1 hypothetical protein N7515_008086 [Penicillium bovifimosum]